MNTQQQHELLRKHMGRVPEHYTLYPLPDDKCGGREYSCKGVTLESGEILLFEFGFCVPGCFDIPWEDLEKSIPYHCKTCEWDFWRGKGTSYCTETEEISTGECPNWEISPDVLRTAAAEYYKQLHEKHYGKISISV